MIEQAKSMPISPWVSAVLSTTKLDLRRAANDLIERLSAAPDAYGGIVVNGSEVGLRIHSGRNMPVGTKLNIVVLFRKEFQLTHFEVVAEVIWKDLSLKEDWSGYQYGLEFVQIKEEDLRKLQKLFPSPIRQRGES